MTGIRIWSIGAYALRSQKIRADPAIRRGAFRPRMERQLRRREPPGLPTATRSLRGSPRTTDAVGHTRLRQPQCDGTLSRMTHRATAVTCSWVLAASGGCGFELELRGAEIEERPEFPDVAITVGIEGDVGRQVQRRLGQLAREGAFGVSEVVVAVDQDASLTVG